MSEEAPRSVSVNEWQRLVRHASRLVDVLEDGAYVRVVAGDHGDEFQFYASALNKPAGWRYPFTETIAATTRPVGFIGRVWSDRGSSSVEFEVSIAAAAQAILADYAGGAGDYDEVTIEQALNDAVQGTPADKAWLTGEFDRLRRLTRG